jgi:hypothetical protein
MYIACVLNLGLFNSDFASKRMKYKTECTYWMPSSEIPSGSSSSLENRGSCVWRRRTLTVCDSSIQIADSWRGPELYSRKLNSDPCMLAYKSVVCKLNFGPNSIWYLTWNKIKSKRSQSSVILLTIMSQWSWVNRNSVVVEKPNINKPQKLP